jgi:hypothetical protein
MASPAKQVLPEGPRKALRAQLFPDRDGVQTYAILDGASVPGLVERLHGGTTDYACLYRGELEPDIAEVAPYLCRLERDGPFTDWLLADGWGNHWGVFALSRAGLAGLRRHLRQFLLVRGPDGRQLYFRYYDPRVLRAYLPTCNGEELETVFGPIDEFLFEGKPASELMRFSVPGDVLRKQSMSLFAPMRDAAAPAAATGGA